MRRFIPAILALSLLGTSLAYADDAPAPAATDPELLDAVSSAVENIGFLRKKLSDRYEVLINAQSSSEDLHQKLEPIETQVNSLQSQLEALDANVKRSEQNVQDLSVSIQSSQLKLKDLLDLEAVREKEYQLADEALREFVRLSYGDMLLYSNGSGSVSALKAIASGSAFSDATLRSQYSSVLEGTMMQLMQESLTARTRYSELKNNALIERGKLVVLITTAEDENAQLKDLQDAKKRILEETKGQESEYQKLLETYAQQEADAMREIADLRDQMSAVNEKLQKISGTIDPDTMRSLLSAQGLKALSGASFNNTPRFIWPGDPGRGITAYFHDPDYREIFHVWHPAIDFRMYQGSPVVAAGPGVVLKVHDGGYGYSYIALAHPGDFQTVYGHLSGFDVKEGDTVTAGQLIGRSGATPGTKGAGLMTTGPHLHFEIHKGGEPVDPLQYLPLEYLPLPDVPVKYIKEEGAVAQ